MGGSWRRGDDRQRRSGRHGRGGPPEKGEPEIWDCPGGTTMIITAGRNGWIDGVKYQAVQFTIDSPEFSAVKVWGGGKDLANPDAIASTQTFPGGSATVTAVPA